MNTIAILTVMRDFLDRIFISNAERRNRLHGTLNSKISPASRFPDASGSAFQLIVYRFKI